MISTTFNLNDKAIVTLTPHGHERLLKSYLSHSSDVMVVQMLVDSHKESDGRYKFQIWDLMSTFGPDCFNGSNRLPFVDNKIEVRHWD